MTWQRVQFTRQDVEAAGKKPWGKQEQFAKEIDINSMAGTAAAFKRAAAEARNVDDLATRATRISQNAGSLNGSPLVKDIRDKQTFDSLRHGGTDMEKVVGHLFRAMKRAFDAEENNRKHINWMNRQLTAHQAEAMAKWNGWSSALSRANQNASSTTDSTVTVSYDGRREQLPRQGVPTWLADQIREQYLKRATEDAGHAEKQVQDEIDYYRHHMTWEARELAELGYELTEGPFKLFTTPEMAKYAAKRLTEELRRQKPDPQRVEFYTSGLKSIAEGIYTDLTKSGAEAERNMSPAEHAYLKNFFAAIDPEALATLGNLQGKGYIETAQRNVANGISALLNPRIGGLDPSSADVPDSLGHFVNYKYGETLTVPGMSDTRPISGFHLFNGFGGIMEQMTAKPSAELAQRLAHSALDVEKLQTYGASTMNFTGSSGMLSAASLNTLASAQLLYDHKFAANLLSNIWDDSQGAAKLITSGTSLPPGINFDDKAAAPYVGAGYNVLQNAAANSDRVLGSLFGGATADHSHLQQAIGETTIKYLDILSAGVREGSEWMGGHWAEGKTQQINGENYRYGFSLSAKDQQSLFTLMNKSEKHIRDEFFTDVAGWQYRTAFESFRSGDSIATDLENVGTVAGTVARVQSLADTDDLQRRLGMYTVAKYVFDAAGTAPADVAAPLTWPFKTAAELKAGSIQEEIDQADAEFVASIDTQGALPGELLVADAAARANAPDIVKHPENGRPGEGSGWNPLSKYITGVFDGSDYREQFNHGFDVGNSPPMINEQPDPRTSVTPSPHATRTP